MYQDDIGFLYLTQVPDFEGSTSLYFRELWLFAIPLLFFLFITLKLKLTLPIN